MCDLMTRHMMAKQGFVEGSAFTIETYFDMVAVTLAQAAKWWRDHVSQHDAPGSFVPTLTPAQLDTFERHLCLGMVKLLLSNALERGLSWREWTVQTDDRPDKLLKAAATEAGIGLYLLPSYTRMWLRSTGDQVQVHVRCGRRGDERAPVEQVWPLAA